MNIDFDSVAKALKQIEYSGYLTLEAVSYPGNRNADNVFEAVCDMANSAKKLSDMIENC